MIRVDMVENQVMDIRMGFAKICYSPDFVSSALLHLGVWVKAGV